MVGVLTCLTGFCLPIVNDRLSATVLISFSLLKVRCLFESDFISTTGETLRVMYIIVQEKGQICTPRTVIWSYMYPVSRVSLH